MNPEEAHVYPDDCTDCAEDPKVVCAKSERPCGHHCNHAWSHDKCCWCQQEWGEGGELLIKPGPPIGKASRL